MLRPLKKFFQFQTLSQSLEKSIWFHQILGLAFVWCFKCMAASAFSKKMTTPFYKEWKASKFTKTPKFKPFFQEMTTPIFPRNENHHSFLKVNSFWLSNYNLRTISPLSFQIMNSIFLTFWNTFFQNHKFDVQIAGYEPILSFYLSLTVCL